MDSLDLIQIFREVARRGSFSATAAAQGVSPASVSKAIAELERRFGLRLFNRTTRKVSLTDAGQLLFERSSAVLELVDLTNGELHQRATRPSGRLSVTMPYGLVHTDLPAMMSEFLRQYPEVDLDWRITDRIVDLAEEGIDLAFRAGPIGDANLIVRRLLRIDFVAVASPAYWRAHGKPERPDQLCTHAQLAWSLPGQAPRWHFQVAGKPFELALQPRVNATQPAPLITLAVQGLGVMWTPRRSLAQWLESGELEPALEQFSPSDVWLYAAYMQRRHNSAALRALLAHLDQFAEAFRQADGQRQEGP
ncbi:MAG: LysR family transcriptional regulator [Burkholderiales bacterium 66-5]|jgi:DNA-binding transcriptional LysR family regulator|uniref:LysR family transcriptional regulator n=1 Tax=Comamonas badia TaxID=265291 RepID=UPI000400263C|nr:LysR family transcriptional regulator [Comamonas badia]OJU89665.1 MAG: LysR family transcriptional regulator [Burkholderiales bacterium 66-5]